jgi:N-acetylglucosaminyl-diphospho-decaprenol L-rhamnosyltransferase
VAADISVIIPSLRGGPRLVELVRRLADDGGDVELLIADNGVPDDTARALRALGVRVVSFGRNLGFGAAVNAAAKVTRAEALVVLNDDLFFRDGLVEALVEPLSRVEMAAGVLLQADRSDRIESAGIVVDTLLGAHDYLCGEPVSRLSEPLAPPLGPCGGIGAYRRDSFAAVSGYDEGFFAYYEDVDLALRLRTAGACCELAPAAAAVHARSSTLGPGSIDKARLVGFGRGYLLRKYGVLSRPLVGPVAAATEVGAGAALGVRHRSLEPLRARLRGWQACAQRVEPPPRGFATVGLVSGLRRRRARNRLVDGR